MTKKLYLIVTVVMISSMLLVACGVPAVAPAPAEPVAPAAPAEPAAPAAEEPAAAAEPAAPAEVGEIKIGMISAFHRSFLWFWRNAETRCGSGAGRSELHGWRQEDQPHYGR